MIGEPAFVQKFSTIQFPNENDYNDLFIFLAENKNIIEKVFFENSSEVYNFIAERKLLIENEIQKSTSIIITHRESSAKRADKILNLTDIENTASA